MAEPTPSPLSASAATRWAGLAVLALGGIAWLPWMATPAVRYSLLGSAVVAAVWLGLLVRRRGASLSAQIVIRRPHWVQTIAHSSIYFYWGQYVDVVYQQVPLILSQVVFAYVLDLLVAWTRGRKWQIGFGPIPIIGSTNLFLWFHADVFYLQLAMVAAAFLSREFLRWRREGHDIHIFNPSGFGLSLASILVIATGTTEWTWGSTIATTLIHAPYMFEWIFAAGIVVQILFGVCLVTMTSALVVFLGGLLWFKATGDWYFENEHIPIAVFLGMHLLITDPVTSPRANGGKVLFGTLYGLAVFPLYSGLLSIGTPSFYDKLLQVPVLNLLVPVLERVGRHLRWPGWKLSPAKTNLLHVGLWGGAFAFMVGPLKHHPGQQPAYWAARCAQGIERSCHNMVLLYDGLCKRKVGDACVLLGDHFMEGKLIPGDETRAVYFYEQACQHGIARGCGMLALAHEDGRGGLSASPASAAIVRTRACELGDEAACVEQAARLVDGRGVPADPPGAARLLEGACRRGHAQACGILGFMLQRGQGIPVDLPRARTMYDEACRRGLEPACRQRDALGGP
ncbi:MAG: SEL1-like repeat protein [Myxococcales bacterium]|nr:SEL1-like repeat protein [Myxococcales bacterium]MCB9548645.1 SEL1-like repeat protein [Myxococcales bacterium]